MRKLAAVFAVLVLAGPAVARAGDVAMRVQQIPLGGRVLSAVQPQMHFNMLAAKWRGGGSVAYRTHRLRGGWSSWRPASSDDPDWTGASDGIQWRTSGRVVHLRAYELWSRVTSSPIRRLSEASSPPIVTRAQWHANDEIVRARPLYAQTLKLAIVHHTAGSNSYTPAQAAAIVRGIEIYHVEGNGWNDIGYNFLVDRYGTIYEGRAGGMTRNVIGAHAQGFNTGTVGIALIGDFAAATPTKAQQAALVELLAWRLDIAHIDPLSTVAYTSGGNLKFRAGKVVLLRAISGHRDTGPTECPGAGAYGLLPSIAKRVSVTGLPKIYGPTVIGALGGPISFQARLSAPSAWTVTVTDANGHAVARGSGRGTAVDWTWHSTTTRGAYVWTISAPDALSATGTLGRHAKQSPPPSPPPVSFTLTGLAADPSVIAPAPDGSGATSTVTFSISAAAHVTAEVVAADGTVVATPLDAQLPAGTETFTLDATTIPDGLYTLSVSAQPLTGSSAGETVPLTVDRTLTGLAVTPSAFSPNGDGVADTTTLSFSLSQAVPVQIVVEQNGSAVATLFDGTLGTGSQTIAWDGTDGFGDVLPPGPYTIVVTVTDTVGAVASDVPVTIDSS